MPWTDRLKELWAKTWPLLLVLAVTIAGWQWLSDLAYRARITSTTEDIDQAMTWARELLGLAGTFAGFLGLSTATMRTSLSPAAQAVYSAGGLAGVLAGATLLNVGGWPIPAALAAMAIGTITIRVRQTWG